MEVVAERLMVTSAEGSRMGASRLPAIQAHAVSLSFEGNRVLDGFEFTLDTGEAVLLRGENGCGKTTLLNVLSGFIHADSGHIRMHLRGRDVDVTKMSAERLARIGLGRLWQDIRLFPTMSALENVLSASPELLGRSALEGIALLPFLRREERAVRERALFNLELVGMADRATSSGDMLSVGQMKRVALARLLQANAELLLLDEPLAGLDQTSAEGLLHLLEALNNENGKALLIVEHQHERMAPICDRTMLLSAGRLWEDSRL